MRRELILSALLVVVCGDGSSSGHHGHAQTYAEPYILNQQSFSFHGVPESEPERFSRPGGFNGFSMGFGNGGRITAGGSIGFGGVGAGYDPLLGQALRISNRGIGGIGLGNMYPYGNDDYSRIHGHVKPEPKPEVKPEPERYHIPHVEPERHHIPKVEPEKYHIPKVEPERHHIPYGEPKYYKTPHVEPERYHIPKVEPERYRFPKVKPEYHHIPKVEPEYQRYPKVKPEYHHIPKVEPEYHRFPKVKPEYHHTPKVEPERYHIPKVEPEHHHIPKVEPERYNFPHAEPEKKGISHAEPWAYGNIIRGYDNTNGYFGNSLSRLFRRRNRFNRFPGLRSPFGRFGGRRGLVGGLYGFNRGFGIGGPGFHKSLGYY